jgi:hypothetical protein
VASDRRTEIQKTYAKYGLDGVASWANAANKVPVVGVYGAAAASLVIAARLPFYQGRAYAAGRNFVGDEPVPKVPTGPKWDRWWINDVAATSTKFYSNTAATSTIDYYWKTMNRWNRPHQKFTEPN